MQWMRNGFGLGPDRDLAGFPRYTVIGAQSMGKESLANNSGICVVKLGEFAKSMIHFLR